MDVRNQQVLLDRDVAALYGVETKRVNEAVRNNPDKFPLDYMFQLNTDELESLRSKFSSANLSFGKLKHTVRRVRKVNGSTAATEESR